MSRVMVEEPISDEERFAVAKKFVDEMKMTIPAVVDSIGDETGTAYAAHPDRLYLVGKNGSIAWAGEKGPFGFSPEKLEAAIKKELGKSEKDEKDSDSGKSNGTNTKEADSAMSDRPQRDPSRFLASLPVMIALDTDKDGSLSSAEIENASAAIKSLDKDESGTLTGDELLPPRSGGRR